ncbi:MAG: YkgJ family cysteine cluster protein [Bacteroidota bacterium]
MSQLLHNLFSRAHGKKRDFRQWAVKVKKLKPQKADELFRQLHQEAFSHIDCLECANCCRGLGPRISEADISRMAGHLRMKITVFTETYLRIDEDGDYVFKTMPCPFLLEDNHCMIYPSRPKACREYPHTDQKNIRSILSLCVKNTETCPAVYEIFERLPDKL